MHPYIVQSIFITTHALYHTFSYYIYAYSSTTKHRPPAKIHNTRLRKRMENEERANSGVNAVEVDNKEMALKVTMARLYDMLVFIVVVLAIIPFVPKHLSSRASRLSFMGTACSSLYSLYALYGLLKLMYNTPVTAGYHQSVWAKIGRIVNPLIHRYCPFLNTPLSAVQRWWLR
ncbi:Bifunctional dihydroflavonol reductase/flavanone reductase [Salix suchowensis]|nr:Bifunctional dihydroflavonol reductase/flavanone reductase [Salix suchowensis]